jgi:pyruvate dehydrogenase E2 component (dihydrolipoamide acetyltransferase)
MITRVEIPKLTLTMEEATLVKWLKHEGDCVEKDESLFELETDKTVVEVPSPSRGLLKKILVPEGTVAVGATVAWIGEAADQLLDVVKDESKSSELHMGTQTPLQSQSGGAGAIRVTPAARRRSRELGVELDGLVGTGPGGRVTQEDVERSASGPTATSASKVEDYRRTIAERTSKAWHTVPHIHIGGELLATGIWSALESGRETVSPTLTITDLLLSVTASLLGEFKSLNAIWRDSQLEPQSHINLAFAVQTDFGVVTPVIHDANQLSLPNLCAKRKDLMERARIRRLDLAELTDGTFTVTNLGMYPVDFFAPVINHPQSAILATGRVRQVAAVRGIEITPEWRMWANLAVDHRVTDGATGGQFLKKLEGSIAAL